MLGLNKGYTLLELMVTLAIVAILASLAGPAFNDVIEKQRVRSAADNLASSLNLARSDAITRNATITVAQVSGGWAGGWTVKAGATELRLEDAPGGVTIAVSGSITSFTFNSGGRPSATPAFTLTPVSGDTAHQRCVSLSLSGKSRNMAGACS